MIESYQDEMQLTDPQAETYAFATIGEVYDDGVSLIFPGSNTASEKHYKVNAFVIFSAGDRVRIIKDSGTYVVEYPVGNPRKKFNADAAATAETASKATTAETADKLSSSRTISIGTDITGSVGFDGSANVTLNATSLRTAALKNAYRPNNTSYDVYLYAQYNNRLFFKIGRNGTLYELAKV